MTVDKIWFDEDNIYLKTKDGREKCMPLSWFPRLEKANIEDRENYTLSPFGIHWQKLDEDLSFEGFFRFDKEKTNIQNL